MQLPKRSFWYHPHLIFPLQIGKLYYFHVMLQEGKILVAFLGNVQTTSLHKSRLQTGKSINLKHANAWLSNKFTVTEDLGAVHWAYNMWYYTHYIMWGYFSVWKKTPSKQLPSQEFKFVALIVM